MTHLVHINEIKFFLLFLSVLTLMRFILYIQANHIPWPYPNGPLFMVLLAEQLITLNMGFEFI